MKNQITEIVFILDKSGSMGGLESDTVGGTRRMLDTLYAFSKGKENLDISKLEEKMKS